MGAGVCALLLLCLACGLACAGGRTRRGLHRIIIREQVVPRGRGPQQHRTPARGHRDQPDGRFRGALEYSDEFEKRPAESSKKYKKLPPQSSESVEDSQSYASDWQPVLNKNSYYYSPLHPPARRASTEIPPVNKATTLAPISRDKPLKSLPIHETVDITTAFPPKKTVSLSPSVYKNNLKRANHMNYFNYKITRAGGEPTAESKQKENYDLPRRRPVKKQAEAKKPDGGYQVHEEVEGDIKPPKYTSFNALAPSLMKSVPLYPAIEDNQIVDRPKSNKTAASSVVTFGKRQKVKTSSKSSTL